MADRDSGSSSRRRRERRLRSWWRHEQQSVRTALTAALHHSRDVGPGKTDPTGKDDRQGDDGAPALVKSIPPTTENWLRKRYKYSKKNYKSTEDKHETNHINNKYNDTNMNTRKMHNT